MNRYTIYEIDDTNPDRQDFVGVVTANSEEAALDKASEEYEIDRDVLVAIQD